MEYLEIFKVKTKGKITRWHTQQKQNKKQEQNTYTQMEKQKKNTKQATSKNLIVYCFGVVAWAHAIAQNCT